MHNHRIVSNGRGGDEDVCCLSASPGIDLRPRGRGWTWSSAGLVT
jgi:hypothetical protein